MTETGKANARQAGQARQMLAQSQRDLKTQTRQTMDEAGKLAAAIRKDVSVLKANAGQILADASVFMKQTGSDNARLRTQTHKMLAVARNESKAQTRQVMAQAGVCMAQTKQAVAGLKLETGRVLADASDVMKKLSEASRHRAAGWQGVLHMLHGGALPSASCSVRTAPAEQMAKKISVKRTKSAGKSHKRRVA